MESDESVDRSVVHPRPTSSSTYIPLQPFAPFGHRLISQVLRLNLITASGSFPTVFHLQH